MKTIIVLISLFAIALTAPIDDPKHAQILRYENDNIGVDGYKFAFEQSDGIKREEHGELRVLGPEDQAIVVRGSVTWVGDDGQQYTLNYVADENGYQPEGAHLPHP